MTHHAIDTRALIKELLFDGFVVIKNAVPQSVIDGVNEDLQAHFDGYPNSQGMFYGDKTRRFGGVFAKSKNAHILATHPAIIEIMERIMLPYCDMIQINLTQAISIQPGETEQMPHRDDEMFPLPHPGVQLMINCMWALSPFTAANGGTRLWPNTHHGPIDRDVSLDDAIKSTMEPTDVLIYLGSTVHGGGANKTNTDRKGLVISFSQGWLRQSENQYLANPPEVAAKYPQKLRELIGYKAHRPNLGWVEGQDPSIVFEKDTSPRPTVDLLPPHLMELVDTLQADVKEGVGNVGN